MRLSSAWLGTRREPLGHNIPLWGKKGQKDPRSLCHFQHQGPHSLHQSRPELTELHCAPLEKELPICVPHPILAPLHTSSKCHKYNSLLVHMPQKWSCLWSLYDCTPHLQLPTSQCQCHCCWVYVGIPDSRCLATPHIPIPLPYAYAVILLHLVRDWFAASILLWKVGE